MTAIKPSDIIWSRNTFNSLKDGGTWAIPRSGLIFKRVGDHLEIYAVLPWISEMDAAVLRGADIPASPEELKGYQRDDFVCIQRNFNAAGIEVTDPRELLIDRHVTEKDLQKSVDGAL